MLAAGFGITARIYTAPDSSFVAIDHYRLLAPEGSESSAVRTYDIALRFARYFIFDYESRFRMNLSVGAGLIGSDIADRLDPLFYDLYVALGDPHVELRLGGWKLMVRADLHFAVGAGNNLLGRRWILSPVVGLPPVSVGIGRSW
jgi:hypothetical protein